MSTQSPTRDGRLLGEARRARILDWLREEGSARVSVLARAFEVSEVTVRQDLEKLEADGHIVREHGGAYMKTVPDQVRTISLSPPSPLFSPPPLCLSSSPLVSSVATILLYSFSTTT